ncbi:type II toxin-antitoxin system PemK/MazF family toxin [Arthrobacter psychrolactophilus]
MSSTSDRIFKLLRSLVGALLAPGKSSAPRGTAPKTKSSGARPTSRPTSGTRAGGTSHDGTEFTVSGRLFRHLSRGLPAQAERHGRPRRNCLGLVAYEEDYSQGKHSPVLIVGRSGKRLLALMLTSKDHSNDHRGDNDYIDIGTGPWDKQGRPSEVKLDRVLQVSPADMRREGAVLDAKRFAFVASGLRSRHGWK